MPTQDEDIARHLSEALASGELKAAPSYGKPMPQIEGWEDTPPELRLPFKILKDAGFAPPEIALFHERARLAAAAEAAQDDGQRMRLQRELSELEQKIALRLEALRVNRSL
jgi:hypothetical protein